LTVRGRGENPEEEARFQKKVVTTRKSKGRLVGEEGFESQKRERPISGVGKGGDEKSTAVARGGLLCSLGYGEEYLPAGSSAQEKATQKGGKMSRRGREGTHGPENRGFD